MKKQSLKAVVPALLLATALLASCKKEENNNNNVSNATRILGTWNKTFDATDDNGNNSIESNEKTGLSSGDYEYSTYQSNGIIRDSLKDGSFTFKGDGTYSVTGDYLTISIIGITVSARITQLDDHNLVIQDTSAHPASWTGYVK